ncbi:hypothetical protein NQ315_016650 [Exocentrus adspersus]|uniref:Uncharacterized protein n=1 Tax=Exocentrus adspersus TaxID=1586481 RepID=A0AAV8VP03_9CUCU|nr:hypothetical protein NQ315_016650 [Exocentrus adspersus]
MITHIRNKGCVPDISSEGVFVKPLTKDRFKKDDWFEGLSAGQRMYLHHTLASARRFAAFKPHSGLIPSDDLDFILSSCYNHSEEIFPDPVDVYLQPDTEDIATWRRLKNTRNASLDPVEDAKKLVEMERERELAARELEVGLEKPKELVIPYRYNFAHKVLIGGITEKKHPSNIKLMNSSHHSPQTNAGYSRQPSDGTVFQY